MLYKDNSFKFVAVLNRKVPLPQLMNALGHMTAGLTSQCDFRDLAFLRYQDGDGSVHPNISQYPFIVLSAKNGNQIRTLRYAAIQQGIHFSDFVDTMLGSSAEDQLQKTRSTKEINLDYFGICLFSSAAKLDELTRKFSLFTAKTEAPPQIALHDPLAFGV